MTPRRLIVARSAERDLRRCERYLTEVRSPAFAQAATDSLLTWLERLARDGAQLGTALADDPAVRSFGYDGQATIIARFRPGSISVLRVFFKGQDWSRGPGGR